MSTVNAKMTAIADEIRELSGTTNILSLDEMTTSLNNANTLIVDQSDLISQINNALEGKVSSGDGSVSNGIEWVCFSTLQPIDSQTYHIEFTSETRAIMICSMMGVGIFDIFEDTSGNIDYVLEGGSANNRLINGKHILEVSSVTSSPDYLYYALIDYLPI